MTAPSNETALQKEQRLFRELSARLRDAFLHRMFDLRPEKASRRSLYLFVLFLFSGFVLSLFYYPPGEWAGYLGTTFGALLSVSSSLEQRVDAINELTTFISGVVLDAKLLQYLPVFLAPFFIALQSAAIYLADVFELEDVGVARRFINSVALSGSDETIRITRGEIAETSRESPAYLIGGPGRVVVDLDSVALFERADGTPHVIGPTGKEQGGKASLEGFERFRQAFDIRDHYVELRDQDANSMAVESRSLDGIRIKATDVRLMFSIYRGEDPRLSAEYPYPFNREAVEQLVYKADSRVTPELPNPSTFEFSWVNNMVRLIRGRLGDFMSQHNLTEYMASIGMPEVEKVKLREEIIHDQMQQLTQTEDGMERREIKPPPEFQARHKIRNLFAQFADEFTDKAHKSGVELHWIGIGTWESPVKIVPEKHLEAWMLTQENLKKDSPEVMNRIEQEEAVNKLKELIQKVPLDAFERITSENKQPRKSVKQMPKKKELPKLEDGNDDDYLIPSDEMKHFAEILLHTLQEEKSEESESKILDHPHGMQALLIEYRKQFQETADFIRNKNEPVPRNILDAIRHIDNQIAHWVS
jgi:hypothetical protein